LDAVQPLLEWRSFGIGKTIFQQVIHLAIRRCGKVPKRGCDLDASFREFGENRLHVIDLLYDHSTVRQVPIENRHVSQGEAQIRQ